MSLIIVSTIYYIYVIVLELKPVETLKNKDKTSQSFLGGASFHTKFF